MLQVEAIHADIGPTQILFGVGLTVDEGEMVGVIGRNGAGKTTLMRCVIGALAVREGRISLDDRDITNTPAHQRPALGLGYMPEDRRLVPDLNVEANILLPAWAVGFENANSRLEWIYEIMPEVAERRNDGVQQLSGGQQKLVALARAMMAGRKMLLLDEPFEGVAPVLARRLSEVLVKLKTEGGAVLIADSNEQHASDLLDRTYHIERGEIVEAN